MPKKKPITSPSQRQAASKYKARFKYAQLRMTEEQKEIIDASLSDVSMNQYILDLIREDLKKKGIELP